MSVCLFLHACMHASVYTPLCLSLSTCACVYMHIFLSTCLGSLTHGIWCEFSLDSAFIPVINTSRSESLPQPFWVPNWGLTVLAKASDLLSSYPSCSVKVLGSLWQCALLCHPYEQQLSAVPAGGHVMFHHPPWDCRARLGLANSASFVFWFCKYTEDQVSVLSHLATGCGFPFFTLLSLYIITQRWREWNPTANLTWCVTLVSKAWSQGAQNL